MENSQIKLSIIIPVYNRATRITKALDSIPIRDDIEVIVIDDCSTDNTMEVLKSYTRLPLIILQNDVNSGPGIARNKGLDVAQGEYVTFLDSDDWLVPENISALLDNYNNDYDIIWFNNKLKDGSNWWANDRMIVFQGQFIKRSIIGDTRNSNKRWMEDREFVAAVKAKNPKQAKSNLCIYIYDYRTGSPTEEEDTLTYQFLKGNGWHW